MLQYLAILLLIFIFIRKLHRHRTRVMPFWINETEMFLGRHRPINIQEGVTEGFVAPQSDPAVTIIFYSGLFSLLCRLCLS